MANDEFVINYSETGLDSCYIDIVFYSGIRVCLGTYHYPTRNVFDQIARDTLALKFDTKEEAAQHLIARYLMTR